MHEKQEAAANLLGKREKHFAVELRGTLISHVIADAGLRVRSDLGAGSDATSANAASDPALEFDTAANVRSQLFQHMTSPECLHAETQRQPPPAALTFSMASTATTALRTLGRSLAVAQPQLVASAGAALQQCGGVSRSVASKATVPVRTTAAHAHHCECSQS